MVFSKENYMPALLVCLLIGSVAAGTAPLYAGDDKPAKPATEKKLKADTKKADEKSEEKAEGEDEDKPDEDQEEKKKFIKDIVEDYTVIEGLFKLYQDPKTGSLFMEVSEDKLDKELIYFSHTENGIVESGHFKGRYNAQKIIKINKYFNKLEFSEQNPYLYFNPEDKISKSADANVSNAVLYSAGIKATSEDEKTFLINVDRLFKSEAFDQIKASAIPKVKPWERFKLGKLSGSKTRISSVKNYPENLFVTVDYVYSNPAPMHRGSDAGITDARNIKVRVQHTLIPMPENNFKPRFDDARVGYFLDYVNDMTSRSATPWRDMINRWNLVKKNPGAALSEPVKPILWWIENTTPDELRPMIAKALTSWNIAFEKAGFKNAIQVKIQPDDADWDAGDIRYNVLRWTSSPRPPFGGYGPSFSNPRTGEILGADIMLEYSFLTNRLNQSNIFDTTMLTQETTAAEQSSINKLKRHMQSCNMANHLQLNNMLGKTLNTVFSSNKAASAKLVKESIYYLILHEVGHTLGLNHNMKATQSRSYETAHTESAQREGLIASVMDYPSINFAPIGKKQAHYYTIRPGSYDIWAIQFGYDPALDDPKKRNAHLARSTEKLLAFGNDADDMRSNGRGIDPRINIYDMTDDAVQFAADRLRLDLAALDDLKSKFNKPGQSYQELRNAYFILTADMAWQSRVISRYIGGVYVDRAVAGQPGASAPYQPVEKSKQKQAMELLRRYVFAPDAFKADAQLLQHLAIQRRGFLHGGRTEDPKVHSRIGTIQADILSQILHPRTLLRLVDSSLYGNDYSITEVMQDMTSAVFDDDSRGAVNSFRQELQVMYVNGLKNILFGKKHTYIARSNAFANLQTIRKNMARWRGGQATRAHRSHISFLIDKALEIYKS